MAFIAGGKMTTIIFVSKKPNICALKAFKFIHNKDAKLGALKKIRGTYRMTVTLKPKQETKL